MKTFEGGNTNDYQPFKTFSEPKGGGIEILADYVVKYNSNFDYSSMGGYNFNDNALCHLIPETGAGFLLYGSDEGKGCDIDNMVGANSTSFMPLGFIATGQGVWSFTEKQGETGWNEPFEDDVLSYQHEIMPMIYSPSSDPEFAGNYNAPAHILFNQRETDYSLNLYKDNRLSGSSEKAEEGILMEYQYIKISVPSGFDISSVALQLTGLSVTDLNSTNQLLHVITWADETGEEEDGLEDFTDFLDSDDILNKAQICSSIVSFEDIADNSNKVCNLNLALTESDTEQYNIMVGLRPSSLRTPQLFVDAGRSSVSAYDSLQKYGVFVVGDFTGFEYLDFLKTKLQNSQNDLSNNISLAFNDFEFYGDEITTEEPTFFRAEGYYQADRPNVIQSTGQTFPVFIGRSSATIGDVRPGNLYNGYDIGAVRQAYNTWTEGWEGILNPRIGARTDYHSNSTLSNTTLMYENTNDEFNGNCKYFSIIQVCSILKSEWTSDITLRLPIVSGCFSNDFEYFRRKTTDTATNTLWYEDGYITESTAFSEDSIGLYRLDSEDLPDLNSEGITVSSQGYGQAPAPAGTDAMDPNLYPASNLSDRWIDNWTKVETFSLSDFSSVITHDQPASTWDYNYPNTGSPSPILGTTGEGSDGTFTKAGVSSEGLEITLSPSTGAGNGDYANFYLCFDAVADIDDRDATPPTPSLPSGRSWDGGVPNYDHIYNKTNYVYFCPCGTRTGLSQTFNIMGNLSAQGRSYSSSYLYYPALFS